MIFLLCVSPISTVLSGKPGNHGLGNEFDNFERSVNYKGSDRSTKDMNRHNIKHEIHFNAFLHTFDEVSDPRFPSQPHSILSATYEYTFNRHKFSPPDKDYKLHAIGHGEFHGGLIHQGVMEYRTRMVCHHHVFSKEPAYKKRDDYNQTSAYCDCLFENGITKCDLEKEPITSQNSDDILLAFNSPMKIYSRNRKKLGKRSLDWQVFVYAWLRKKSITCFNDESIRKPLIRSLTDIFKRFFKEGGEGACAKILYLGDGYSADCTPISIMLKVHHESNGAAPHLNEVGKSRGSTNDFNCEQAVDVGKERATGRPW